MTTPILSFRDVCFSYGGHEVLHNVSFSVSLGCFIGIVGPNGGGKTTLLRLMLGMLKPDRGAVELFGTSPEKARRRVGYVMQKTQYDPLFPADVFDIVLMGRAHIRSFGPYTRTDRARAEEALEQTGMGGFGRSPFSDLSGGQQQRVLMAQALAGEPELLLLDEPTANIDVEGEKAIHLLLTSLQKKVTVVSVSHNVNTVLGSVSHVLCVNRTAAMSPIGNMNPEKVIQAYGGEMAVLHHDPHCHVYDASHTHDHGHHGEGNGHAASGLLQSLDSRQFEEADRPSRERGKTQDDK